MEYYVHFQGEVTVEADSPSEAEDIAIAEGPSYYYIDYTEETGRDD